MSDLVTVPVGMVLDIEMALRINTMRDSLIRARADIDHLAAKVLRLDNELIDAHGRIETLELKLAAATAELDTWAAGADD
jgi:predicted  nucleic acid-binding Zn-ribbon protein